jgi:AraC-like DNA-binding protein
MLSDVAVRFWQPASQAATELVGAYLEAGRARPHVHEEWQFAVPEIPSKLSVGAFRRYTARPTDVTVVAPYEVHTEGGSTGPAPNWRVLYVAPSILARAFRGATGTTGREMRRLTDPVLPDPAGALELRGLLRGSEEGKIEGSEFLARALRWLEQILRRHPTEIAMPTRMPAVERARKYLQDRATQAVTLPEVGAVVGVTVSHLVRSFSRAVGLPPKSYHAQVRLARARQLLAQGKSATWVAYECGFADQSHLSRRFKECYGLTPGAFQSQYRGQRVGDGIGNEAARLARVGSNAA